MIDLSKIVKPLVWLPDSMRGSYPDRLRASTPSGFGDYSVAGSRKQDKWQWFRNGHFVDGHHHHAPMPLEAAKAAAQADYTARILAALDTEAIEARADLDAALAPAQPAPSDWNAVIEAAKRLLALHDGFWAGADTDKDNAHRLHVAAAFGAQAFAVCPMPDARPAAMVRALLLALIDQMHPDLDYLRAKNIAVPVNTLKRPGEDAYRAIRAQNEEPK